MAYRKRYRRTYKKKRTPTGKSNRRRGARSSLKASITQVLMKKTETKYYDIAEENVQLWHNVGASVAGPVGLPLKSFSVFFNPWADINKGTGRQDRIGDKITPRGMSIKLWIANKLDRPNLMYRIMVIRAPKAVSGAIVGYDNIDWFDAANLGSSNNRMILPLDNDRGAKAYYDKVINLNQGNAGVGGSAAGKEGHKLVKLWIKRKSSSPIVFDNAANNRIVNNPLLFYVIPYDSFGTLVTDNVASCSYYCRMYYKDF